MSIPGSSLDVRPSRKLRAPSLYLQVLLAIALAVLLGCLRPTWAVAMQPLGDGFVKLIKMLIAPVVFTTLVVGIAGMEDLKAVGRTGAKALIWFEFTTTLALAIGIGIAHLVSPGEGLHVVVQKLDHSALDSKLLAPGPRGFAEHVLSLIPDSFFGAFAKGDMLQILLLALLTGIVVSRLGVRARALVDVLESTQAVLFGIVGIVMRLSPIGAFGAMAFTVGKYGLGTLSSLAKLIAVFYGTSVLFVCLVLGLSLRLLGLSLLRLLGYLREELAIVLGTSSSESALPRLMAKLEALGCAPPVVRLVVPAGYSFNLDGTSIYLTLASLFVAQALDIRLSFGQELSLLFVLLLTSKGAAGVTGSGFITLAATLSATGSIPVAGLTLLLGIDRFMSEARALTNFVGNAVATLVVSRWENQLDLRQARALLGVTRGNEPAAAEALSSAGGMPPGSV
ncbi:MAG TPA: C4-dicarboxylate transporter DctA [Polyangiaceae bacterium]|nr:C4-dicarboxylate transporter DctA [Polyangiaceae bacterium]